MPKLVLTTFEIENFRSIQKLQLEGLGGYNLFIGRNNVGKSNILNAIDFFQSSLLSKKYERHMDDGEVAELFHQNSATKITLRGDFLLDDGQNSRKGSATIHIIKAEALQFMFISQLRLEDRKDGSDGELMFDFQIPTEKLNEFIAGFDTLERARADLALAKDLAQTISQNSNNAERMLAGINSHLSNHRHWSLAFAETAKAFQAQSAFTTAQMQAFQANLLNNARTEINAQDKLMPSRFAEYVSPASFTSLEGAMSNFHGIDCYKSGEGREEFSEKEKIRLFELFTNRSSRQKSRQFADIVRELLDVEIEIFREDGAPIVQLDDFLHTGSGSGIRGALRLVFDLCARDHSLALIEEPELHLHPTLSRAVAGFLRSRSAVTQMFINSHSPEFIDLGREESAVFLVESVDKQTRARRSSLPNDGPIIMTSIGLRPSSVLMYDRVVLVEGPSDEEVLRSLAATLKLDLVRAGVGFIHLKGGKNHHFLSQEVIQYFERSQGKTWCLIDSDEMSTDAIERYQRKFQGIANVNAVVLKKREIENYLLSLRSMHRAISLKRSKAGMVDPITLDQVSEQFDSLTGEFREELIRLRIKTALLPSFYFEAGSGADQMTGELLSFRSALDAMIAEAPDTIRKIREQVAACSDQELLARTPGTFMIKKLFNKFGVGFDKADSGMLAAFLPEGSIHPELADLLKEIATRN